MKKIIGIMVCVLLLSVYCAAADEKVNFVAPSVIPGMNRDMKSPGFWISRHPAVDRVILNSIEISRFNEQLIKEGSITDLLNIDAFDLNVSRSYVQKEIQKFERGDYYDRDGKIASRDFFRNIKENLNMDDLDEMVPRYAFIVRQSDQRLLPTEAMLMLEPFDFEFDEVQNSSLDAGEPVIVFYETLDEKWVYTQTHASAGWIKKENLLFVSSDEFKNLMTSEDFVVVTSAKADLYLDSERTKYYDYIRMGMRLPIVAVLGDVYEVEIAPGQHYFVGREDVQKGFLTYTPRHIIEQAFKMLNAPYGWGGVNGEQDCSAFLKGVFATVGILLPRNSAEQGESGALVKKLDDALPAISVAQMKGHIVLYLGTIDQRYFAIHEAYAYREPLEKGRVGLGEASQERARVVNRVIVSDLNLGQGSKKGSLLERIIAIREIR